MHARGAPRFVLYSRFWLEVGTRAVCWVHADVSSEPEFIMHAKIGHPRIKSENAHLDVQLKCLCSPEIYVKI